MTPPMAPAVVARQLRRSFDSTVAVAGLDLEIQPGELYGLVGPDGAGKTTTVRMLAGLVRPDSGEVRVLDHDPLLGGRVRDSLGLMPQEYSLYLDLSIRENLRFFGHLYALDRKVWQGRVDRLMSITRLAPFMDRRAGALSGGMYKKLALACALLHEPRVLLLDEPTNGVDPVSRRELWDLIYGFVADGMSVLVSTPYMEEAERCHRVGLLSRGRLIAEGDPSELIRGLSAETYVVRGPDGEQLFDAVPDMPGVIAASPAGSELRIVVAAGASGALRERLAPLGASLEPCKPSFEDLFLVRVGEDVHTTGEAA